MPAQNHERICLRSATKLRDASGDIERVKGSEIDILKEVGAHTAGPLSQWARLNLCRLGSVRGAFTLISKKNGITRLDLLAKESMRLAVKERELPTPTISAHRTATTVILIPAVEGN